MYFGFWFSVINLLISYFGRIVVVGWGSVICGCRIKWKVLLKKYDDGCM